jgi:SWI/SNF-related matrix-associated actin-dependent regulator 1 of chromatin subfamily A
MHRKEWWITVPGKVTGKPRRVKKSVLDVSRSLYLPILHERLVKTGMLRRRKVDVLPELPPKVRELIVLPPPPTGHGEVDVLGAEHEALHATGLDYESAIEDLQKAPVLFSELAAARKFSGLAKVPAVVAHVNDLLENKGVQKVVVFAHHYEVIWALEDAWVQWQAVVLTGTMTEEMRDRSVRLFQTNPDVRVFVGSLSAAGVGITLTAASNMVFAEIDWKDMRQIEDRIHRIGQRDSVLIQSLVFDWSVDANMMRLVLEKMRVAEQAIDGKETE